MTTFKTDSQPAPRGLRILLADGQATVRSAMGITLRSLGHDVDVVGDGGAALDAATENDYDAVLMDVHMPGMDGLEATQRIRSSKPAGSGPRIFAQTAEADGEDRSLYRRYGVDETLEKPVRYQDLVTVLNRWFPGGAT
jgi:CheY-like chemotaxis protein